MTDGLNMSRRLRRTAYTQNVEAAGVTGYSIVNHMLLPKGFQKSVEEDYWHLREHVQIWDVSCQRQVEIAGPDAEKLVQLMTPRNISKADVGDCYYLPIIDENAGIINDPVLLKLGKERFWLSIADSDVLLYAKGLALGANMNVNVFEPDVCPLAIQGPKAENLISKIFGNQIKNIDFFKFGWIEFQGTQQLIARSGYSRQGGFEIYLQNSNLGSDLWETIWEAGIEFEISPGCPNLIEGIEGGLLSYGNEFTRENNPLEIGLAKFCSLDGSIDFIGRAALEKIATTGVKKKIRGVTFDGDKCPTCSIPWPVVVRDEKIGQITSAIWSPRLKKNVGLSLIDRNYWLPKQSVEVHSQDNKIRLGEISSLPFI